MSILAIDPGNIESAFVMVTDDLSKVIAKGKLPNADLERCISLLVHERWYWDDPVRHVAVEMVASYGMPVGAEVFETCVQIGRFERHIEIVWGNVINYQRIYRMEEKIAICHNPRARDSNIRQALIDRFGAVGTKKNPGYFYGFKKDIWAAMAVAVTYHDKYLTDRE
ncbi:hypothetical protein [Faecalibaculum rodentium]|uniref:hypothetical protein n=2 Tax=Faecalibaculum rodentium TaxID=1702221 RepID=UPI0025B750BC|nr:hypothetical protein [Faecalibaculum rodentium]